MGRTLGILLPTTLLIVFLSAPAPATVTVNVQKAKEDISSADYRSAITLLEEAAAEEPGNAEIWVLLGECGLYTGNLDAADSSFGKALAMDPSSSAGIESAISVFVVDRLSAGDQRTARIAFEMGLGRIPSLGVKVTRSCAEGVPENLDKGREEAAEALFRFASDRDPGMRQRICDVLSARARASTGERSLRYVVMALHYGDKNQAETSKMALHLANELGDEERRAEYLVKAIDQIGEDRILDATVEYYSNRWGMPVKVTLEKADSWVSLRKAKTSRTVRYLALRHWLTRGGQGPTVMEPATAVAGVFSGQETAIEGSYDTDVWFCMNRAPTEAYVWILD